jgi:hypothetical protein
MKRFSTLAVFILIITSAYAQVNGYAKVTAILGPVITVNNVNESYDQFNIGDRVMVIQMQDDVIGANTANNSSYGNLANIANAGRYEFATIALVTRVASLVTVLTLNSSLSSVYNLGSNGSVQIITFPTLGTPNFTTTSNISALPWNGDIGGIVAFRVAGKLILNHDITADYAGFRGGAADANNGTAGNCGDVNYYSAVNSLYGNKGEGIYKANAAHAASMGRMINGGGGGNGHNGGGAGGGNYTSGGDGGIGYGCTTSGSGVGGAALGASVNSLRFFPGGGGGSGESNNGGNNKGGNGGGIIFIKAAEIKTVGSGARRISANGENGGSVGNDGAGGGGAGGTTLLEVDSWDVVGSNPLVISTNGGNGGSVGDGSRHGGGAGGGQGSVIYTSLLPSTNVTSTTSNGIGGLNWTGGARAADGAGTNNTGVITSGFIILPLKLTSFTGALKNNGTSLQWTAENEQKVNYFEVQYSENGASFSGLTRISSKGNTAGVSAYEYSTLQNAAIQYYRLKMVDEDGKITYSQIIAIRKSDATTSQLTIFPNPATQNPVLNIKSTETGDGIITVLNMHGTALSQQTVKVKNGDNPVVLQSVNNLAPAVYNIRVVVNGKTYFSRLIMQ